MVDFERVKKVFIEEFQGFDLLGYKHEVKVESCVIETNKPGTPRQSRSQYPVPHQLKINGKPVDLYPDMRALYDYGLAKTYREVIAISYYFESVKVYPVTEIGNMQYEYWEKSQIKNEFIKDDLNDFKNYFDESLEMVNALLNEEKISFSYDFNDDNFIFKNENYYSTEGEKTGFPLIFRGTHIILGDEYEFVVEVTSKLKRKKE